MTAALLVTSGCATPPPKSGKGFTLPEGDAQAGKENYIRFQCNACHTIDEIDQQTAPGEESELSIALGGEVTRIQTYGELVTSIINPSHRLAKDYPVDEVSVGGQSKMKVYNDVMTVTELTDLIAFVQSKYELLEYELTDYPLYGP
ncbi:MAG: cytochrome C [Betaproteobacteria bacterium]|nr:MAG: cytochrome C [Betaproteobacteria bacterium]